MGFARLLAGVRFIVRFIIAPQAAALPGDRTLDCDRVLSACRLPTTSGRSFPQFFCTFDKPEPFVFLTVLSADPAAR